MQILTRIPSPVIYVMAVVWTLQIICFTFSHFGFYNERLVSSVQMSVCSALFWLSAIALLPVWKSRTLWKFLASIIFALSGLVLLALLTPSESFGGYSLLKAQPLAQPGYTAKLERQFYSIDNDCKTELVLSYERNYWNIMKETKVIFSLHPSEKGTFEISPDGKLITVTAACEDERHETVVQTFSTDWYLVRPQVPF